MMSQSRYYPIFAVNNIIRCFIHTSQGQRLMAVGPVAGPLSGQLWLIGLRVNWISLPEI